MHISILSVFPELYTPFLQTSLVRRAQDNGLVSYEVVPFHAVCAPKERIDAPTFGHGAGMLIRPEVVERAVQYAEDAHGPSFKIFFSPQGKPLTQYDVKRFAQKLQEGKHLMLVAARYEGMDARVEEHYADALVSVGDFVLMGGDIPAMMVLEGLLRHIPGVVGRQESVQEDSFTGPFFDYPEYTAPVVWHEKEVPEIVRSGDHGKLREWRLDQAARKTVMSRFDWLRTVLMPQEYKKLVTKHIPPHYVVLMHDDVLVGGREPIKGATSVTSLDIHDIARSSCTYGIKNYCIVTPLLDQQKIVQQLIDFWMQGAGVTYNEHRHQSLESFRLLNSFEQVIDLVEKQEGEKPLVIATSARMVDRDVLKPERTITYHDQSLIWQQERPVILVLGTGQGLTRDFVAQCDYLLVPLEGFTDFNHLSVRSAAAIILDRWLGSNIKFVRE
ncbi:tRNA (guanosine(37)-N1)-methyltransferase TrmD [Candidatus Dependentiae bacterium]|nr:tRNA (guanosine(37)-N1)-methyltransferase TrmD [Candidatus Dependentiae bacterium]